MKANYHSSGGMAAVELNSTVGVNCACVCTGAHKRKERSTPIARVVISKRKLRRLARSKNFPIWKFFLHAATSQQAAFTS